VLRLAAGELLVSPDTPAVVVINEAVDLAGRYGTEESGAFVNGVLDRIARGLRPEEMRGSLGAR
jgi:N utilization substance protein B